MSRFWIILPVAAAAWLALLVYVLATARCAGCGA